MSLTKKELEEILQAVIPLSRRVGKMLLEGLKAPKTIEFKDRVDLVTQYDRRAEEEIIDFLSMEFPDFGFLAEESGKRESAGSTRWIIDPLDGTTNFAHGHPVFAVSIALEENGEVVAGHIEMPALGYSSWAAKGLGARGESGPLRVSATQDLDRSLVATGFPYNRRTVLDNNTDELKAVLCLCQGMRRCGSAVSDLALVARGVYDGFWEPDLKPWDVAAGALIVKEAGGVVSDYSGEPFDIEKGWIVATNGKVHQELLDILCEVGRGHGRGRTI